MSLPAKILAFTDMSARSDRAVRRAFELGRTHDLPVTVVSVLDDAMPGDLTGPLRDKARAELNRLAEAEGNGVRSEIVVRVGDPTAELLAIGMADPDALVVMGIHRPRPFLDAMRETTMTRLVRRAGNPVLLVCQRPDAPYSRIIAATDFSPASTASLRLAHALCPDAGIRVLRALHVPYSGMLSHTGGRLTDIEQAFFKEAREQDARWRADDTVPAGAGDTEIEIASPYIRLKAMADAGEIDLIAVGAHGRVGAAPALLGSLSIDLMRDPPCDILIARP